MINWLKVSAIKAADWINAHHDPFDDFTRPIIRRTQQTLAEKEKLFSEQLLSEFRLPNGIINYKKVYAPEPLDLGDQCLWHGINTGNLAMKYHVTQTAVDLHNVSVALHAMRLHYRPIKDGTKKNEGMKYLIRGIDPDNPQRIETNASNDSLTGHLYGLWMVWKWCPELRDGATQIINDLAMSICRNDFCMVNENGKPTTYGRLIDGWKTDPLRLTLMMAVLLLAYSATSNGYYLTHIRVLTAKYKPLLKYPKVRFLWWEQSYDTHRSAIHLAMLADLAMPGEMEDIFKAGLRRLWNIEKKKADPWLLSFVAEQCAFGPEEWAYNSLVISRLNEYEFEERGPMLERRNTEVLMQNYWKNNGVRMLQWNKKTRASQPLPFWMMASQDFFPQRDLRSPDGWEGSTDSRVRHSGADFLGSYWRFVAQGRIRQDQ